jgi:hypothetical protein
MRKRPVEDCYEPLGIVWAADQNDREVGLSVAVEVAGSVVRMESWVCGPFACIPPAHICNVFIAAAIIVCRDTVSPVL